MPQELLLPVRRRLDIKAMRPAGGGPEFLTVSLVDPDDHDQRDAQGTCTLPAPDFPLGDSGLFVEEFLQNWRAGVSGLDSSARLYGLALYRQLLGEDSPIRSAWQEVTVAARQRGRGLRLEIRCPLDSASKWMGQPLSALPFELLCDERGYLFRRAGWSAVRRSRGLASRAMRLGFTTNEPASVQVAWANVTRTGAKAMDDGLFTAHDDAVQVLGKQGQVNRLPALPGASRKTLTDRLKQHRPHILVWVSHGLDSGSGLLLHDGDSPLYPTDPGQVVSACDFASTVRQGQVDVALLWSCYGAGTFRSMDVGVAEALLDPEHGDVAAVLASFSALDAGAVSKLSRDLISAWGQAGSDLEAALATARADLEECSLNWARPVLFLRTPPPAPLATLVPSLPPLAPVNLKGGGLRWLPQLPSCTAHYVDHHQRLERLTQDLDRHPVVVLEGLSGVGKTELALAMAHRRSEAGEDVAFIDLSGQPGLAHLRQTLGLLVAEKPFDDDDALLRALSDKDWLLVLDNAEDVLPDSVVRHDLLRLLTGLRATGPGFRAIVTSRHALAAPGAVAAEGLYTRELQLLDAEEARVLFITAAGPRLAKNKAVPEVLDPLLDELGGVARAIVLMAGQLGGEVDVSTLLQRLAQFGPQAIAESELHGLTVPAALDRHVHKTRLTSALRLSLASAARQAPLVEALFDVLGTLPGGLLQAMLPLERRAELGDALSALLDHHLVRLSGEQRRIMMAAPVRAWAWQRWRADAAPRNRWIIEAAHRRLAVYANHLEDALGTPLAQAARLQFLAESSNLIQLLQLRTGPLWQVQDDPVVSNVLQSVSLFEQYGGTARSMVPLLEPVVLAMLERASSAASAASAMLSLAKLKICIDQLEGARQAFEQALTIYRQIEDRLGEGNTLQALGGLKMRTADLAGTREAYELALPIFRQIGEQLGEANTLRALGDLELRTSDLASALQAYEQALRIYRKIEARLGEANTLQALGNLKMRTYDLAGARKAYELALPIFRQIGEQLGEANTLRALGDLELRTYDLASARQAYEQALRIYRKIEARLGEANTLLMLGDLKMRIADLAGAHEAYEQALSIYRQIEDCVGEANTLVGLGNLKIRTNDLDGARQAYEQALLIFSQVDERLGEANTLLALGQLKMHTRDLTGARHAFELALPIYRQIEARLGQANTLLGLGQVALADHHPRKAFALMLQAKELQTNIDARLGLGGTHGNLSRIAAKVGAFEQAVGLAGHALAIFEQVDDSFSQMVALHDLGYALLRVQPEIGIACLMQAQERAESIGDRNAEALDQLINAQRPADLPAKDFAAALAQLRAQAAYRVKEMFVRADAAVSSGQLNLYELPEEDVGGPDAD